MQDHFGLIYVNRNNILITRLPHSITFLAYAILIAYARLSQANRDLCRRFIGGERQQRQAFLGRTAFMYDVTHLTIVLAR